MREMDRREALLAFGGVSLTALLAACGDSGTADPSSTTVETRSGTTKTVETQGTTSSTEALFDDESACVLTAEETDGPYYFDVDSIRSDIREARDGATLRLAIRVREAESCASLENAVVDIWHCDAGGLYSGFESASTGGAGGGPGSGPTDDETYLRGAQVTNSAGIVEFKTIYPGWYRGRTVHIHAKVHLDKTTVLTTQLFFDDGFTDGVYKNEPYASDSGRDTLNANDSIFDESLLLKLSEESEGYLGVISLDVQAA